MCGGGGDDPKEQESKLALAQQAANALQRYGEVFVPLENMFISDTKAMFEDGASDQAMAAAQIRPLLSTSKALTTCVALSFKLD